MVPRFSLLTIVHELIDTPEYGIMIVLFFATKVSSLISVEGGKAISLSLNEINISNT